MGGGSGRVLNYLSDLGYTQLEGVDRDADALKAIGETRLGHIDLVDSVVPAELDVEFAAGLDVRPN